MRLVEDQDHPAAMLLEYPGELPYLLGHRLHLVGGGAAILVELPLDSLPGPYHAAVLADEDVLLVPGQEVPELLLTGGIGGLPLVGVHHDEGAEAAEAAYLVLPLPGCGLGGDHQGLEVRDALLEPADGGYDVAGLLEPHGVADHEPVHPDQVVDDLYLVLTEDKGLGLVLLPRVKVEYAGAEEGGPVEWDGVAGVALAVELEVPPPDEVQALQQVVGYADQAGVVSYQRACLLVAHQGLILPDMPDMDSAQGLEETEDVQQPQNDDDDHDSVQDGLDGVRHRDEPVDKPEKNPDHNQGNDDLNQRHCMSPSLRTLRGLPRREVLQGRSSMGYILCLHMKQVGISPPCCASTSSVDDQ